MDRAVRDAASGILNRLRDSSAQIASTARVDPAAVIGAGAVIGEFCIVERDVVIGANTVLEPYVYVKRWTTLGERNAISAGTVLGTDPLDKNFTGERSYLRIGDGNVIREHYTISRGTAPESETVIGDGNYIMTSGHIAHNCRIGNRTVIASCALVAGHAEVEDEAFVSGGVVVHQHSKIGRLAMIGGNSRVNLDVPPFFLCNGNRLAVIGLNLVGLKRAGFSRGDIQALKIAYRILYRSGLRQEEALARIEAEIPGAPAQHLVRFIRASKRGVCRDRPGAKRDS
jgi:UDP-N-acetylglucosamine acyltransferase